MKKIKLTQGQVALVDDKDYDFLNQFHWFARKCKNRYTFYSGRMSCVSDKYQTRRIIHMHHIIVGYPKFGFQVDHIDGNGLNNQKNNLRFVTNRQNQQNLNHFKDNKKISSKYPGVCWEKRDKKWKAYIKINGKLKHLGHFINEIDAFQAYKNKLKELNETIVEENIK